MLNNCRHGLYGVIFVVAQWFRCVTGVVSWPVRCHSSADSVKLYNKHSNNEKINREGREDSRLNSKRKGNTGERELLSILAGAGSAQRNDQRYTGGKDNPDISFQRNGKKYHVECKRCEKLSLYEAMQQAIRDANGNAIPVVMHRRNNKEWLAVLRLSDFLHEME